ncbi:MAG: MoxR family ATPase [Cyclobacteriaceae bacterium]|nr:MoxR family ATPase [Cyclobacteriaceae bacterium]
MKPTSHKDQLAAITNELLKHQYVADTSIAMALYLSGKLKKPLLIEGPAGVGKTEIAKVLARVNNADLIRLQCYEGLDVNHAIYEWNYQWQILHLKMQEKENKSVESQENEIFSEKFLLKRPLLQAIQSENNCVLLVDEIDRADEEFESYLLEILSDWQISIPELGTIRAKNIPHVVLTGNRTRELSEALRRRCLYLYIDYPSFEKEVAILKERVPGINETLARQISSFMQELRQEKIEKIPGIAETIDWATSLAEMHFEHLDKEIIESTLGVILKDWEDIKQTAPSLSELLEKAKVKLKLE